MKYGISLHPIEIVAAAFSLMKKPADLLAALRPKTLPAAAAPVFAGLGVALAYGALDLLAALFTLVCAASLQAGANLVNDYLDFLKGHDTSDRVGPRRVIQAGRLSVPEIQCAIAGVFAASGLSGLYLVWRGGAVVLALGLCSMAAAVAYSWFSKPLGFTGGGEAAAFLFFGPLAAGGTFFLQTRVFTPEVLFPGISMGLYSLALLTVNNFRDMEEDRKTGKETLVTRFGPRAAVLLYGGVLAAPLIGPGLLVFLYGYPPLFLLPVAALFPGVLVFRTFAASRPDRKLNKLLFATSLLMLLHGLLYSAAGFFQKIIR